jgi:hypothetical protein
MKQVLSAVIGFAVVLLLNVALVAMRVQLGADDASVTTLNGLKQKTGWIWLGDLTPDLQNWATGADPNADFFTGTYEIIGKSSDRRKPVLPDVGDQIRLARRCRVVIPDYARSGEKRALDSPFANGPYLQPSDNTGIYLPPGTILEVRAVQLSPVHQYGTSAYARVSPPAP